MVLESFPEPNNANSPQEEFNDENRCPDLDQGLQKMSYAKGLQALEKALIFARHQAMGNKKRSCISCQSAHIPQRW
ncbi:hypothetical protein DMENIID0001_012700 [Sergentomyia squamirostris]